MMLGLKQRSGSPPRTVLSLKDIASALLLILCIWSAAHIVDRIAYGLAVRHTLGENR